MGREIGKWKGSDDGRRPATEGAWWLKQRPRQRQKQMMTQEWRSIGRRIHRKREADREKLKMSKN